MTAADIGKRGFYRRRPRVTFLSASLGVVLAALAGGGCGGGGSNPAASAAGLSLRVAWPTRAAGQAVTRAVPEDADSVVVRLTDGGGFQDTRILNRPSNGENTETTINFFALNNGPATITATAFDNVNGQGAQIGEPVQTTIDLGIGGTGDREIVFNVPFERVEIVVPGGNATVLQGGTLDLAGRGFSGAFLVTTDPPGQWSSSDTNVATVNAQTGVVTGVSPGQANITFLDTAFNKQATVNVRVRGGDSEVIIQ